MLSRSRSGSKAFGRPPCGVTLFEAMSVFLGGSAYTMVRDIADGYVITSELTFKKFLHPDFQTFGFELDKLLREIRGNVPPTGDVEATQKRQRRMQRLQQALTIANNVRARTR
jgi:hypothetical protein